MTEFDVFAPPGMFTARGSSISISSSGRLYFGHGSREVTIDLAPLQWQLLSVGLVKVSQYDRGPITIETEVASLKISRPSIFIVIEARDRSATVKVALSKSEAGDLRRAARSRSPQPQPKESV
jgi:hypothetical protein